MLLKKAWVLLLTVTFSYCVAIQNPLKDLMDDMKSYPTKDNYVHSGDPYEHTIWVVRSMAKFIKDKTQPWTEGIDLTRYKSRLILAAFLHDIGKRSGDSGHVERGVNYLTQQEAYHLGGNPKNATIDFKKVGQAAGLTDKDMTLIAILVRMSHKFGDEMDSGVKSYIDFLSEITKRMGYPISDELIRMCILVSVSDVMGFNKSYFDDSDGLFDDINYCLKDWKVNVAEKHHASHIGWDKFRVGSSGVAFRQKILKYYEDHKKEYEKNNAPVFLKNSLEDLAMSLRLLKEKISFLRDRLISLQTKLI
jgi:hypothetical protein